jgi:hypothetical protein
LQNATVFTSSRQESVGQRLQCLSLEAECVCVCTVQAFPGERDDHPHLIPKLKPSLIWDLHRFPNQTPGSDSRFRT